MKNTILTLLLLASVGQVYGQEEKASFHVTSVEQGDATDYCSTGKCTATRIAVEGYTQDQEAIVQYVLNCVEIITNDPSPHYTTRCVRVHSHGDYTIKIGADYVWFGNDPGHQTAEPYLAAYSIKSEKEIRKSKAR